MTWIKAGHSVADENNAFTPPGNGMSSDRRLGIRLGIPLTILYGVLTRAGFALRLWIVPRRDVALRVAAETPDQ